MAYGLPGLLAMIFAAFTAVPAAATAAAVLPVCGAPAYSGATMASTCQQAFTKAHDELAVALATARKAAIRFDEAFTPRLQPSMAAELDREQSAWERWAEASCSFYARREMWGMDGRDVHGPACDLRVAQACTRQLNELTDNMGN
jgi:hypothetical protein